MCYLNLLQMGNLLFSFYLLTALVWLNRARRAWRALKEIPTVGAQSVAPSPSPAVSILVPVKNEEDNIGTCLSTLLNQGYPALEIIVINDHSTDRTPEILAEAARLTPDRIKVLEAPAMPPGWTGKNWALAQANRQGLPDQAADRRLSKLAQGTPQARGEWLLFTDADTRHEAHAMASVLAHAEGRNLDLLTLTPRCLAEGFWEKTLQPAAMSFLGLWFPLFKVNDPDSKSVFGNGQFLMIRKKVYETLGGHEKVKDQYLEDFALVKEAKAARFRVECALGTKIFGTRMYRSFGGIWAGWRRIYLHAFEKNPALLFTKSLSVLIFSTLPFVLSLYGTASAWEGLGLSYPSLPDGVRLLILFLIWGVAWKAFGLVGAPRAYSLLHPLAGLILAGILSDAAWQALRKKEVIWR